MALNSSISEQLKYLRTQTIQQLVAIVDASYRGDPNATPANNEYFNNYIHGRLKALGWAVYMKNVLYVKSDAPNDFNGDDSMIFQTAQQAIDAIPTSGGSEPSATNPYTIIVDAFTDMSSVDWSAHKTAGTYPFVGVISMQYATKRYRASLVQSGTNAPVATVLENTLGATLVWSYSDVGEYLATLTGAFTANKTAVSVSNPVFVSGADIAIVTANRTASNQVTVESQLASAGVPSAGNGLIGSVVQNVITIEVYTD